MSVLLHGSKMKPIASSARIMAATAALSRRSFLSGRFSRPVVELLPPWALPQATFEQVCTRCDACITACPNRIVKRGAGSFPTIDFLLGSGVCSFCGECLTACLPQALKRDEDTPPWHLKASIAPSCLAQQNVVCRSCGDACGETAIRFRPRLGGAAQPELDAACCTGCGACVGVCPVGAIKVAHPQPSQPNPPPRTAEPKPTGGGGGGARIGVTPGVGF
jgi:ferredoxin-type protein NapF